MKIGLYASLAISVLLAVMLVQSHGRISTLEEELANLQASSKSPERRAAARPVLPGPLAGGDLSTKGSRQGSSPEPQVEDTPDPEEKSPEQSIGELMRALAESEAGAALRNYGNRERANRLFGPLIEEFGFNDEEKNYFLSLAGPAVGANEGLWQKLIMARSPEDRRSILDEYQASSTKRSQDLRQFFNNDADFQRYEEFEARVPEMEQMSGIRSAMEAAGVPLNEQQESALVETMYQTRVQSGLDDRWQGEGALKQIEEPGMVERLEADWSSAQQSMNPQLQGILEPAQQEAFSAHQQRVFDGVKMGLRFAEAAGSAGRTGTE